MKQFLPMLNDALKGASLEDMKVMNQLFEKSHMWNWLGPEYLKVLLWLREQGSGTYDIHTISRTVAEEDTRREPWPGPVMIERILANLEDAGFIRVIWAIKGIRTNQPFSVECEKLFYEWKMTGEFWNNLGEAVQSAGYRDLKAMQRLYKETSLLRQPVFYLRVLAWAATIGSGPVAEAELHTRFADIYKEVKFAFDGRNPEHALRWLHEKGLLGVTWGSPGEPFQLDIEPLRKWGFETEVQAA